MHYLIRTNQPTSPSRIPPRFVTTDTPCYRISGFDNCHPRCCWIYNTIVIFLLLFMIFFLTSFFRSFIPVPLDYFLRFFLSFPLWTWGKNNVLVVFCTH